MAEHVAKAEAELTQLQSQLPPRSDLPVLRVPRLKMTPVESQFSLADITDLDPFRKAGERIASNPEEQLRRTRLSARVVEGLDGVRRTELTRSAAVDRVSVSGRLLPLEDLRDDFTTQVLGAPVVPARATQRAAAAPLINAFLTGLGELAFLAAQPVSGAGERHTKTHGAWAHRAGGRRRRPTSSRTRVPETRGPPESSAYRWPMRLPSRWPCR
jgi:hypothetical protein